jgi:hypothetical protein
MVGGVAKKLGRMLRGARGEARAVIAVTRFTDEEIVDCWPKHAGKVRVIHGAPGPEFRVPTPRETATLARETFKVFSEVA